MNTQKLSILGCVLMLAIFLPAAYSTNPELDADVKLAIQNSDIPSLATWFANGGDINRTTKHGNTLLMLASKIGDKPTLDYLFKQLPDVNAQNNAGATALMIAAKYGHTHVVNMLLEKGADPVIRNNYGVPASRFALAYGHPDVYRQLQQAVIEQYRQANVKMLN